MAVGRIICIRRRTYNAIVFIMITGAQAKKNEGGESHIKFVHPTLTILHN